MTMEERQSVAEQVAALSAKLDMALGALDESRKNFNNRMDAIERKIGENALTIANNEATIKKDIEARLNSHDQRLREKLVRITSVEASLETLKHIVDMHIIRHDSGEAQKPHKQLAIATWVLAIIGAVTLGQMVFMAVKGLH